MTGTEALDTLIFMLEELLKIAPPDEHKGLRCALGAAEAVREDVDDE